QATEHADLGFGVHELVLSADTIRSQVMTMQMAPPITQPWVAATTGLLSLWLTWGTAFHMADGGSLRSAPTQKAGPSACKMPTRNPFIDDLTKMANGAVGALTGVKDEVEARIRDQIAKILDGMDIPRRDEFDAVKAMAAKAREENEELKKQIAELQAKLSGPQ